MKQLFLQDCFQLDRKFANLFSRVVWLLPIVWGAYLFDIFGGEVGSNKAIWIVCALGGGILLMLVAADWYFIQGKCCMRSHQAGGSASTTMTIELTPGHHGDSLQPQETNNDKQDRDLAQVEVDTNRNPLHVM
jgi:hypothetical protein